ncbi:putative nucleotidyltransferase [Ruminiclostridium sufflavum DSM 19573]|uniref:tRNA(Met) cytidine acetate ligase n=1 Tax=Ruminiclostridium sufflavum DSM 19573 TaxID=1121337 RepID=A0A318XJV8_9FIRM|nr:nucleotidyltransferase [Ruminiclostridium sufflavum]PYG87610.1 putative nucleotidyltransferase [Ruminiclostridium sufflavum DSM 19573]
MKVLGIIAEYNPFHNGHKYHLEQSKELTGCDAVVCAMSGNFIQRGEPAVINKFARADIALQNGVDLVIELPLPFAMSSAESFAFGAVKLLDSIGIVDCISFGSEQGDLEALEFISDILVNEPAEYKAELKKQLSLGLSFPVCRQRAVCKYMENKPAANFSAALPTVLETSNNILGIEYLKALKRLKSNIRPYTVERIANLYNSKAFTGNISSATAIRNSICSADALNTPSLCSNAAQAVPDISKTVIEKEFNEGRGPVNIYKYENILLALIRNTDICKLGKIAGISEGLEYRIKKAAELSGSFEELLSKIGTKRYTKTRIQRILLSLTAGITKRDTELFMQYGGPQYARILGFNKTGRELLSRMKRTSILPVITKPAAFKNSCNGLLARMLEIEAQSTDIYVLGYSNSSCRKAGQEYTKNMIIYKQDPCTSKF